MGIFKLDLPARMLFTQILEAGSQRALAWNARSPLLTPPQPNVIRADRRFETRAQSRFSSTDSQLVNEFKMKLRQTEDLIGKLGYSLRELTRDDL